MKRLVLLFSALSTAYLAADQSAPGVRIETPSSEWVIIVTPEGYSDLLLDKRPGFIDREYLSGEWAAAIHYEGGSNPTEPIWFRRVFAFPCWTTNSNFQVDKPVTIDDFVQNGDQPVITRAHSIISNGDVEITIRYEMIDSGEGNGIAQGNERDSTGGDGSFTKSTRHFLRQTYEVKNISGGPLTNIRLYQFLHGLHSVTALQDNRLYTGLPFEEYRYDSTQRGVTRGFDAQTGQVFAHDDVLTMHAMQPPSNFEVGRYGIEGTDSHEVGKPSVGVHLSIEANDLSDLDFFDPPAPDKWVSGGMCFDLVNLADGVTTSIDVLLSLSTTSTFLAPPPIVDVLDFGFDSSNNVLGCQPPTQGNQLLVLDFNETNEPDPQSKILDGFILYKTDDIRKMFPQEWEAQFLVPAVSIPHLGLTRYCVYIPINELTAFFRIQGVLNP